MPLTNALLILLLFAAGVGCIMTAAAVLAMVARARDARDDAPLEGVTTSLRRLDEQLSEDNVRAVASDYRRSLRTDEVTGAAPAVVWAFEPSTGRIVHSRGGGMRYFDLTDDAMIGANVYDRPDGEVYRRIAGTLLAGRQQLLVRQVGDDDTLALTAYALLLRADGTARYVVGVTIPEPDTAVDEVPDAA